jgi:hypothetical protein
LKRCSPASRHASVRRLRPQLSRSMPLTPG